MDREGARGAKGSSAVFNARELSIFRSDSVLNEA